jgi:hypothetical protein
LTGQEIKQRFLEFHGEEAEWIKTADNIERFQKKRSDRPQWIKDIKQRFSKFYSALNRSIDMRK